MDRGNERLALRKGNAVAGLLVLLVGAAGGWLLAASILMGSSHSAQAGEVRGAHIRIAYPADGGWESVDIQMLILVEAGESFEELAEAARETVLARFEGGVEVQPQVGAQFEELEWKWPEHTATWAYNPAGKPAHLQGELATFQAAAETWNNAGADFAFTGGGTTTATPDLCNGGGVSVDGENTVGWGTIASPILAMTCVAGWGSVVQEIDMEFATNRPWTTGATSVAIDLQSVATHEFGHALGLDHTDVFGAVMWDTYVQGTLKRNLHQDDIDGVIAIYGAQGASPTPTQAPSTPTATQQPPTPTPTQVSPSPTMSPDPIRENRAVAPGLHRN